MNVLTPLVGKTTEVSVQRGRRIYKKSTSKHQGKGLIVLQATTRERRCAPRRAGAQHKIQQGTPRDPSGNRACTSRGLGRARKPLVGPESLPKARIIPARLRALSNTCYQFTTPLESLTSLGIVLVGADRFWGLHGILEPTEYLTAAWLSSL